MKYIRHIIEPEQENIRIKTILRNYFNFSSAVVKQLKNTPSGIMLNGKEVYTTCTVREGDILEIFLPDKKSINIEAVEMKLDILYEDEDILVINKPRNMPTHPSCNHHDDTLANGVMAYYKDRDFTFRVITRLDRETSGIVLVAKNKISASELTRQISNGTIVKTYHAVCHGTPEIPIGTIDVPISRVAGSAILREVNASGKKAVTNYQVLDSSKEGLSLVKLTPLTGRTHQIRVHLSYLGHPIYGDDMYGSPVTEEFVRLHCSTLEFKLPISEKCICITAPLPKDMLSFF